MKNVLILFASTTSLVAFTLIGATIIETGDVSLVKWLVITFLLSICGAIYLMVDDYRNKYLRR